MQNPVDILGPYVTNFSQKLRRCLILSTEVERVRGSVPAEQPLPSSQPLTSPLTIHNMSSSSPISDITQLNGLQLKSVQCYSCSTLQIFNDTFPLEKFFMYETFGGVWSGAFLEFLYYSTTGGQHYS
jgi:hypothetical protein